MKVVFKQEHARQFSCLKVMFMPSVDLDEKNAIFLKIAANPYTKVEITMDKCF